MTTLVTIGLDLAKTVFQAHGVTAEGKVLVRRQLRRGEELKFFQGVPRLAWSGSKLATRRTIGSGRLRPWGIR